MVPPNKDHWTDPEYIALLNYIIEKTKNVEAPRSVTRLAKEFKEKSGAPQSERCLVYRIEKLRTRVHSFKRIDTKTKVKVLFALSASVNVYFLRELRKNALVGVDDKLRIIHYKANDGNLELRGDHSPSAKNRNVQFESKQSILSWIIDYFENKNDSNGVPANKEEEEMWNLIEFITEKCDNVNSPLNTRQLSKEFHKKFGISRTFDCVYGRVEGYCCEIQNIEFLDTHSKVRQLFGLSATLDSNFLKELRKDAVVEVDNLNRITKYTSNDGLLTLHGDHSLSAKRKLDLIARRKNGNTAKKHCSSRSDDEDDSVHGNVHLDELSNELYDYDSNYSIEDQVKLEPFRGSIQEDLKGIEEDEDIQQIPKLPQAFDEHDELIEVPIKEEQEEPAEVKPETSHNPKIKFFEAMQSLILCLDTPSLSFIQLKIQQKMQKIERSHEVILNNEIIQAIELLIARIINHSVENHSKTVKSMNLSNFLCYLKASLLNSKMSGAEGLVQNISELIEESQNKRILTENVANALRTTLVTESF